jgi:C4-dicarboxylate-specific signal transduction histidine kinase
LAEQQITQRDRLRRELRSLRQGLEHVAELVRGQQQFTQRGSLTGEFNPSALMEEALRLVEQSLGQDPELEILRFFDPNLTTVSGDRHRTLDILVNLIQNAFQAMEGQVAPRTLILRTSREQAVACLEVKDSGPGIDPAHLTQVFAPGFTTRKDGHGYGLHTAANAALEMGGHLEAHSSGCAQGATFQLQLATHSTHAGQTTAQHISVSIPETAPPSGVPYGIHQTNPSRG